MELTLMAQVASGKFIHLMMPFQRIIPAVAWLDRLRNRDARVLPGNQRGQASQIDAFGE
jgi:hypothetical protein